MNQDKKIKSTTDVLRIWVNISLIFFPKWWPWFLHLREKWAKNELPGALSTTSPVSYFHPHTLSSHLFPQTGFHASAWPLTPFALVHPRISFPSFFPLSPRSPLFHSPLLDHCHQHTKVELSLDRTLPIRMCFMSLNSFAATVLGQMVCIHFLQIPFLHSPLNSLHQAFTPTT